MKSRMLLPALVAVGLLCMVSASNASAFELLNRVLYGHDGGCGCDAAPTCGCDNGCNTGCRTRCRPERCHRTRCCAPKCGCEVTCAAPAPKCGCDNDCAPKCCREPRCCRERCCREPRCCRDRCHRNRCCENTCGCEATCAAPAPKCGCGA
jgi:hypothetical protein